MSGIFGIYRSDNQPVDRDDLIRMRNAMSYWGLDGSDIWTRGCIGLGHLMTHNTPEAVGDRMPRADAGNTVILTARARIDNREDLFETLGLPWREASHIPDSDLILAAHEKWGMNCVSHLLGDWAFALWDVKGKRLLLTRDHCGNTGLYFLRRGPLFAFASSLKGLLALPWVEKRPDLLSIAQLCARWPSGIGSKTCHNHIDQLLPAHRLLVGDDGERMEQYWRLEDCPQIRFKKDEDYVHAFTEVFEEAVRCRLRSRFKIGISLSGGLDSGSIAAVAAKELAARDRRLAAFGAVPGYNLDSALSPTHRGDETPCIEATCRHIGNVDLHYVTGKHVSPVSAILRMHELWDEPGTSASNYPWLISRMALARRMGVDSLLTGNKGNGTISWNGTGWLSELFRKGDWGRLLSELKDKDGKYTKRSVRMFLGQVIRPMLPWRAINQMRYGLDGNEPWAANSALNPDFAKRLKLTRLMYSRGYDPANRILHNPIRNRYAIIRPGRCPSLVKYQAFGAGYGMEIRDPTSDKRILEFCMGIPVDQYIHKGQTRWLIRRAMAGRLPHKVLFDSKRGLQSADICQRICKHYDKIAAALKKLERNDLAREILDLPRMWTTLAMVRYHLNQESAKQARLLLMRGLDIGLFLTKFQ